MTDRWTPGNRWTLIGCWTLCVSSLPTVVLSQDTVPPVEQGVRIGITYTPGVRPGMLVLGGPRGEFTDSLRAIIRRDLDYGDRFEMITLPQGDSLVLGVTLPPPDSGEARRPAGSQTPEPFVNYPLYAALGADFAVAILPGPDSGAVIINLYDVHGAAVRRRLGMREVGVAHPAFRMEVHRAADELVRAATGEPGIAATRILFVHAGRVYVVDSDGANLSPLSPAGANSYSPAWDPTGRRVAYSLLDSGWASIILQDLDSGESRVLGPTQELFNFTSAFSPDGGTLAFARAGVEGTHIYTYNLAQDCCLQRLTVGRFSDNLSPTFSPDGRQIAFVSTRAGLTQIYAMSRDGTGQQLFAPFDYGVTGGSYAPEWSPDGRHLVFHRDVAGSPQVFVMDVRERSVRQLTSAGRNEDGTWAPDGRHIAFISNRTGARQVWVIDTETGRVRQLTRVGDARLPAWSSRLSEPRLTTTQP
ncbi:MAG: hypothetical protein ACE5PT_09110 [Gemmatimonadales bacterium]